GAGVRPSGRNFGDSVRESEDIRRNRAAGWDDGAVAELARRILAPAFDAAGNCQRTSRILPRTGRRDTARQARYICGHMPLARRPIAELARDVASPAFHAARARERACVVEAKRNGSDA